MVWTQYLVCIAAGAFYYLFVTSYFTGVAGFPPIALALVLIAFAVGGYAPGLGLVAPRLGASVGATGATLLLLWNATRASAETGGVLPGLPNLFYGLASVPAALALAACVAVLLGEPEAA